jgi:hypothetical protein
MARTKYQPGPATDHYHATVGVEATPVDQIQSAVPTLAEVLAAGNETGAVGTTVSIVGGNAATATGALMSVTAAPDDTMGGSAQLYSGDFDPVSGPYGSGINMGPPDSVNPGKIQAYTDGSFGSSGEVLTSDGTYATWQSPSIGDASASGVVNGFPVSQGDQSLTHYSLWRMYQVGRLVFVHLDTSITGGTGQANTLLTFDLGGMVPAPAQVQHAVGQARVLVASSSPTDGIAVIYIEDPTEATFSFRYPSYFGGGVPSTGAQVTSGDAFVADFIYLADE